MQYVNLCPSKLHEEDFKFRDDKWNTGDPNSDEMDLTHETMGEWIGRTIFTETTTDDSLTPAELTSDAKRARMPPTPPKPTDLEVMTHNLTHMPYRSWCEICVKARGKNEPHIR